MDDERLGARGVVGGERLGGGEREDLVHTIAAVVHDIPAPIQVGHAALACCVEDVLVVVDEGVVRGELEPFLHGVQLAHLLGVEHEHAGLQVVVGVFHVEDALVVAHVVAARGVEVAQKVDIVGGG